MEAEKIEELADLTKLVGSCWTGRHLKQLIQGRNLRYPDRIVDMYLDGEPPVFIAAAVMSVNCCGE